MFQALGVHGPELSPGWAAFLDVALVSSAFAFLFSAPRANRMTAAMLATMVVAMAALRVVMQPLPNVQPVTVAALLVGAHLGARRGVAFAILVTLLSNLLISHGWWTFFQALGWSVVDHVNGSVSALRSDFSRGQRQILPDDEGHGRCIMHRRHALHPSPPLHLPTWSSR